jgi:hypothetical protein
MVYYHRLMLMELPAETGAVDGSAATDDLNG